MYGWMDGWLTRKVVGLCRTHYTPGLGSCGVESSASDDVVGMYSSSSLLLGLWVDYGGGFCRVKERDLLMKS